MCTDEQRYRVTTHSMNMTEILNNELAWTIIQISTQVAAFWINWRDLRDLLKQADNKELQ